MKIAVQGYVDAGREIQEQIGKTAIDAVFVPCGTGTTQAGLILGLNAPVYGITVARDVERCKKEIASLLLNGKSDCKSNGGSYESFRECSKSDGNEEINVLPNLIQYGAKDERINEIITALVRSDGIFLDPVYNAKSFLAMVEFVKNRNMNNVVYVNTGGYPNIFA